MAYVADLGQQTHRIEVHAAGESIFTVEIDGVPRTVDSRRLGETTYSLLIDGRSVVAEVSASGEQYTVSIGGELFRFSLLDERRRRVKLGTPEEEKGRHEIRALMPGKIVEVLVQVGDQVERDQGLLVVEAMKMENDIKSPAQGEVKEIRVQLGQTVDAGQVLAVVE